MKCRNCKNNGFLTDEDGTQYSWCETVYDNLDIDEERKCASFRPATHAQQLRAMTDEELAEFIEFVSSGCDYMSPDCPAHDSCKLVCDQNDACRKGWLDWLKQEVE